MIYFNHQTYLPVGRFRMVLKAPLITTKSTCILAVPSTGENDEQLAFIKFNLTDYLPSFKKQLNVLIQISLAVPVIIKR